LRDRRRTLDDAARLIVDPRRARDRRVIDAAVREEPHVLGCEHGFDEHRRQHRERRERAMSEHRTVAKRQLGEMTAVGREHERRLCGRCAPRGEVGHVGQVARPPPQR
jgi:hypothetical protein